jgi:hypothetical protein
VALPFPLLPEQSHFSSLLPPPPLRYFFPTSHLTYNSEDDGNEQIHTI